MKKQVSEEFLNTEFDKFEKRVGLALKIAAAVTFITFIAVVSRAACNESVYEDIRDVKYEVRADVPKHLQGASITVTLADGKSSTVSASEFMVVRRKTTYVVGQNVLRTKKLTCSNKNSVIAEGRKDYTDDFSVKSGSIPNGKQSKVYAEKEFVPGINYYRRELFDTNFGAGVGIDANGTIKGLIGVDF